MTAGWEVSRAPHTVVYIDAPLERRNFGLSSRSFSVFASEYVTMKIRNKLKDE